MSETQAWTGIEPEKMTEIAGRYEAACILAMQQACSIESEQTKIAARFTKSRNGIWAGIAQELRELGCPKDKLTHEVTNIVNFAIRKRALEGLPSKGQA